MSPGLNHVLEMLRAHRAELRARGVLHAAVFGSTARGEDGLGSDIDLMVDLDPQKTLGIYDFASIKTTLSGMLGRNVDLVEKRALKDLVRREALRESVDAF